MSKRPEGCGIPAHDLECAGCGVRLYGRNVEDVCPHHKASNPADLPRVGQKWRHYRTGTVYRIALLGMLEASSEPAVCYQAVIGDGRVWIRTLHDFMGEATGAGVPRFTRED